MYLYLDLIWLLNFCIDYLLLWLTAVFRKMECKKWRLALASFIGSSYVLFLFIPSLQSYYTLLIKLLLSLVIVYVAFGFGSIQRYVKSFFTFYFVSFVIGGGLLAVHYVAGSNHQVLQGMVATQSSGYGDLVSWLFVVIGFPLMYWFSRSQWQSIERTKVKERVLVQVQVTINGQHVSCQGLVDTGNQLYEPFSKKPVMLMEAKILEAVVPREILEAARHEQGITDWDQLHLPDHWLARLSLIPYRGVGRQMDLMLTFKPDEVVITSSDGTWSTRQVLIGINQEPLATDGLFQAVVHPDLVLSNEKSSTQYREAIKC
ncbi:stage II sporulation protein GA (sporulation sigma-E factor processing peptidase) [Caldalkalibacillus uzonensis]|uniref:Stage II sporulation protein GA (Sporulation sigma-E factor processing peptidase) n=1 Tax=Caldalkalibacillus uzonensis TaxID=353224 RepID=A0ABU0CS30_9BACI|nr:sigma-E processing peptidase SpoIIGA [Caldalkalibacillus uzonensis]MDQ0339233.1 stage II sporulation protein GA (sporulation sigma-E factor processing peptidase) [Caldalkalibacillus uzonensis]